MEALFRNLIRMFIVNPIINMVIWGISFWLFVNVIGTHLFGWDGVSFFDALWIGVVFGFFLDLFIWAVKTTNQHNDWGF